MKLTQTGVELILEYTEPTDNTDGSLIDDLHHTSIFYDLGAGPVNVVDLPATLNTGGGAISYSALIPVLPGEIKDATIFATATDTIGETSDPSEPLVVRLDRRVPKPPFGLRPGNG